jgi:hypothetical protein
MRLQSGIQVVSIAIVSIAVVSSAAPVVSIAAVSIAEPHHVMRLQCWVRLKRKFSFSYLREKVVSFSRKKLLKILRFRENIPFGMRIRIQERTKAKKFHVNENFREK